MHKVVPLKSAQAFHLLRLHYSYTKWSLTNCRKKFSLSGVLLMAQIWQKKFCCFLFKTSFLCKKTNPKETKLCPVEVKKRVLPRRAQENLSLQGHFTQALSLAHIRIHPIPALLRGLESPDQTAQMSYSVTCPYCAWAHTGGNRKPWSIIWIL